MDFEVMLKLGWAYNILKDDREAVRWFSLARNSPDAKTAAEASKAYGNLNPSLKLLRTTVWAFPLFRRAGGIPSCMRRLKPSCGLRFPSTRT